MVRALQACSRDNFHGKRYRCLFSPERAKDTLEPYATLDINVVAAKELVAEDIGILRATSDPYYEIMVNDKVYHVSEHKDNTVSPVFNHDTVTVPIYHPNSIVRINFHDWDGLIKGMTVGDDYLGFVEFRVRELPINDEVSGWFELRFKDQLLDTADKRVVEHAAMRDDDRHYASLEEEKELMKQQAPLKRAQTTQLNRTSSKKQRQALLGCLGIEAKKAANRFGVTEHYNAGEAFLEMQLNIDSGRRLDEWWAFCLPEPEFKYFPPPLGREGRLQKLSLKGLATNGNALYEAVHLNGIMCVVDSALYLLSWHESWVSLTVLVVCMLLCVYPAYVASAIPGLMAFWLYLLKNPVRRSVMVANPVTAPFNNEGFLLVAMLGSTDKMAMYIERLITKHLNGSVDNYADLEDFASRVFRDRRPTIGFAELIELLRNPKVLAEMHAEVVAKKGKEKATAKARPWLSLPDHAFKAKQRVLFRDGVNVAVDAVIVKVNKNGTCNLMIDTANGEEKRNYVGPMQLEDHPAGQVPNIPSWVVPDSIEDPIRRAQPLVAEARRQVDDGWKAVNAILTWKNTTRTGLLVLGLAALSVVFFLGARLVELIGLVVSCTVIFALLTVNSWWLRAIITMVQASVEYSKYRRKPVDGNLRMAFFRKFDESESRMPDGPESVPLLAGQQPLRPSMVSPV